MWVYVCELGRYLEQLTTTVRLDQVKKQRQINAGIRDLAEEEMEIVSK